MYALYFIPLLNPCVRSIFYTSIKPIYVRFVNMYTVQCYCVHCTRCICTLHKQKTFVISFFQKSMWGLYKNVVKGLCWKAVGRPEMVCENKSWNSGFTKFISIKYLSFFFPFNSFMIFFVKFTLCSFNRLNDCLVNMWELSLLF